MNVFSVSTFIATAIMHGCNISFYAAILGYGINHHYNQPFISLLDIFFPQLSCPVTIQHKTLLPHHTAKTEQLDILLIF